MINDCSCRNAMIWSHIHVASESFNYSILIVGLLWFHRRTSGSFAKSAVCLCRLSTSGLVLHVTFAFGIANISGARNANDVNRSTFFSLLMFFGGRNSWHSRCPTSRFVANHSISSELYSDRTRGFPHHDHHGPSNQFNIGLHGDEKSRNQTLTVFHWCRKWFTLGS